MGLVPATRWHEAHFRPVHTHGRAYPCDQTPVSHIARTLRHVPALIRGTTAVGYRTPMTNSLSLLDKLFIIHKNQRMQHASDRLLVEKKYWSNQANLVWAEYSPFDLEKRGDWLAEIDYSGPMFQQGCDDYDYDWGTYTHVFSTRERAREWIVLTMYEMWLDGYQPSTDAKLSYIGDADSLDVQRWNLTDMRQMWDMFELESPPWERDSIKEMS